MVSRNFRIALIAILAAILIVYVFISKIYIPGLVNREIERFSEERGVELSVGGITFDLFRGLVASDAKLGESVSVGKIKVRPSYLTLLSGRIKVDSLVIDRPFVRVDDKLPEYIIRIQKGQNGDRESRVEVRTIDIDDLVINAGGSEYSLRELDIELPHEGARENRIKFFGKIEGESFRQKIEFFTELEFLEDKRIQADLTVPDLKKGEFTDFMNLPIDVSLYLTGSIDYGKGLDARGKITVIDSADKTEAGIISFDASHDKEKKFLSIKSLKGSVGDALRLDMNGRAGNLPDNGKLHLKGELNIPEARALEPCFPFLEEAKLSGAYFSDEVLIRNNEGETAVAASLDADNFRIEFGEDNVLTALKLTPGKYLNFALRKEEDGTRYVIGSEDVKYSGFDYLDYSSPSGVIKSFSFDFKNGVWDVNLASTGESVSNSSLDTMLADYVLNIRIANPDGVVISGDIKGIKGNYVNFSLLTFYTGFLFRDRKINFDKLEAGIENYGDIFVEKGSLLFPGPGGSEYILEINGSKFVYTDPAINSDNIKGLFTIMPTEDGSNKIEGKLFAESANLYGSRLDSLNLDYYSRGNSYKIKNIRAGYSGGNLGGKLEFITNGGEISFDTSVTLKGMGNKTVSAGTVRLVSKGVFSENRFSGAEGRLVFKDLYFGSGYTEADFSGELDFNADPETISIEKGFIYDDEENRFEFTGGIKNYSEEKRNFELKAPEVPMGFVIDVFSVYLPENTFIIDVEGALAVDFNAMNFLSDTEIWSGSVRIDNSTLSAYINDAEVLIEGTEGSITIREIEQKKSGLVGLLGSHLTISRRVFTEYLAMIKAKADVRTEDYIKIKKLKYGFLEMDNIEAKFEMDNDELNLLFLESDVYGGNIYASGLLNFGDQKELYNFNLLFSNLSLESISESLPSMQGYITGLVDGLLWFSAGGSYTTISGPFSFWAKDSKREKRTIGRALLERIGATGRFFTGSSRRYDRGEIAGYIKDGFITFQKFIISNKILGYTDLQIKADERNNSITVKHLLSVIRELARRASRGDVEIEYQ